MSEPSGNDPRREPRTDPVWYVGDRVELAPAGYTASGRPRDGLARGTITDIDECQGRPHAHIAFDEPFRGVMTCTASLRELTRIA